MILRENLFLEEQGPAIFKRELNSKFLDVMKNLSLGNREIHHVNQKQK
jgi:hypothetical protein